MAVSDLTVSTMGFIAPTKKQKQEQLMSYTKNLAIGTIGLAAAGAIVGAGAGYVKEARAIRKLAQKASSSVSDYFVKSARDTARILDPKGCKIFAAKKAGKYGALIGLAIVAGSALFDKYLEHRYPKYS